MTTLKLKPKAPQAACIDAVGGDAEMGQRLLAFLNEEPEDSTDAVLRRTLKQRIGLGLMDARYNGEEWEFKPRAS